MQFYQWIVDSTRIVDDHAKGLIRDKKVTINPSTGAILHTRAVKWNCFRGIMAKWLAAGGAIAFAMTENELPGIVWHVYAKPYSILTIIIILVSAQCGQAYASKNITDSK